MEHSDEQENPVADLIKITGMLTEKIPVLGRAKLHGVLSSFSNICSLKHKGVNYCTMI